jgi:hypothetical protein
VKRYLTILPIGVELSAVLKKRRLKKGKRFGCQLWDYLVGKLGIPVNNPYILALI